MPKLSRTTLLLITPILILLLVQPTLAQNRGVRGGSSTSVRGSSPRSAPRSAPRVSAPRSAPRSAPQSYSAPRSAPRTTTTARSYSAPRNTARTYSAPRSNSTSTVAMPRSYGPRANSTVATPRTNNNSYRNTGAQPNAGSSVRVNGYTPRATYPGRINSTTARVYTPRSGSSVSTNMANGAVRGATPTSTVATPRINNSFIRNNNGVVTMPNGQTATTAVPGRVNNGSVRVAPTNPAVITDTRVTGVRPGGSVAVARPVNPQPVVNGPIYNNTYYVRENCAPRYYNDCYDNNFYSNYNYRRGFRYYQPCYSPFLSYGFFVARPYYYYDYANISYAQPFVYGDDQDYRPAPVITDNQVASTEPIVPQSMEQELLTELSEYVEGHSASGRFQVTDPAFGNQVWNLDLTQAPAVYSIDTNHYSVVAGFEGTLANNSIPSSVGMEFFVARENGQWAIKDAWIVSANGIPRAKKFQSPAFPQVQTWQAGEVCPFSGQPMVPMTQSGAQQG